MCTTRLSNYPIYFIDIEYNTTPNSRAPNISSENKKKINGFTSYVIYVLFFLYFQVFINKFQEEILSVLWPNKMAIRLCIISDIEIDQVAISMIIHKRQ